MQFKTIFYDWFSYNKVIFITINKLINHYTALPIIFKYISVIFNISNFVIYYSLITFYCYYYLKTKPHNQIYQKYLFDKLFDYLVRIGIVYAVIGMGYAIIKFSINLPRPYCSLTPGEFSTILDISKERCLSSFPSAHVALSVYAIYCMLPFVNKVLRNLLSLLISIMIISRITLAMHYPADLIYSIVIALILIYLGEKIYKTLYTNIIYYLKTKIYAKLFANTYKLSK